MLVDFAGVGSAEGTNQGGSSIGDGRPAILAPLRFPRALALAPDESVIIADTNHYVVRRVSVEGVIERAAGSRNFAFSGEGTDATLAGLGYPIDVATGPDGSIYVADAGGQNSDVSAGNRIRRVDPAGTITTLAGGPRTDEGRIIPQLRWLGVDPAGSIFFGEGHRLDLATGRIDEIPGGRHWSAFANAADGSLYAYDTRDGTIVSLTDKGSVVTVVARTAGIREATGFSTFDGEEFYVADAASKHVWKVSPADGTTLFAGSGCEPQTDGPASSAIISDSQGSTFDAQGNFYFTDFQNNLIRRLSPDGFVTTIAGTGPGFAPPSGDGGHPLNATFAQPRALVFDGYGRLLFIDETGGGGTVRAISPGRDGVIDGSADERITTIAGHYAPRDESDHGAADGGPAGGAVFVGARGITIDSQGRLIIADWLDDRIRVVTPAAGRPLNASSIITTLNVSVRSPNWVAIDDEDTLFVQEVREGSPANLVRIELGSGAFERHALADGPYISFITHGSRLVASYGRHIDIRDINGAWQMAVRTDLSSEAVSSLGFPVARGLDVVSVDNGRGRVVAVALFEDQVSSV